MFKELMDMYLGVFQARGESALVAICNCNVPSQVVLSAYKKLPPIEQMPDNEKKEMKQYVRETFPNKTAEEKMNACKIIYTIGTLL